MRIIASVLVAGLLLAGCDTGSGAAPRVFASADNGVRAMSADEILNAARHALAQVTSFHLAGTTNTGRELIELDLKVSGKNALGRTTVSGNEIQILVSGDRTYFKVTEAVLAAAVGAAEARRLAPRLADSWIEPRKRYPVFEAVKRLVARDNLLAAVGPVIKNGEPGRWADSPVILLTDEGGAFGQLIVPTVGEPLPLALIHPGSPRAGRLEFTEYGAEFTGLEPPADDDVIAVP